MYMYMYTYTRTPCEEGSRWFSKQEGMHFCAYRHPCTCFS